MTPRAHAPSGQHAALAALATLAVLFALSAFWLGSSMLASWLESSGPEQPLVISESSGPCAPATAMRLGTTFYRVCASSGPFWISEPLRCSAGKHETVVCPPAISVVSPRALPEGKLARFTPAASTMMTDTFTAHRLCGLRYGGHVATLTERLQARSTLGAATLVAVAQERAGGIELDELAEWVSDGSCDNPSLPGAGCRYGSFPPRTIDLDSRWEQLRSCEALQLSNAPSAADLAGYECKLEASKRPAGPQRCTFPDVGEAGARLDLSCPERMSATRPQAQAAAVAAMRCVVDDADLIAR